ncbi:hypothetical protein PRIC1_006048 [Phytophthora ramorum]|uniref:uncharacterized protein n=1 Tax=Phytophthora ramorum TaxID=164328 RepID=UPI0030B462E3|nr:hypothetical protein KRP23_13738 [Phytophthora ramorum]
MGSRKITRCRGARGQLALYNPQMVPSEVAQELEGIYGFRPQGATGCLAGKHNLLLNERATQGVFQTS